MSDLPSEELGSASIWGIFNPSAGEVDLVAYGGRACRWLVPLVAGTVVCTKVNDLDATIPDGAPIGQFYGSQAKKLKATSTCTAVYVAW